jgi:hypothetical protein
LISLRVGDLPNIVRKLLTRATTLLGISPQSEVCPQSYRPSNLQEFKFWKFWKFQDFQLGSPRARWHLGAGPWPDTKNTIKGKVVASPKSRPWWVLWVCVCPWLIHAPKVFQLVVWFVEVHVNNWPACHSSKSSSWSSSTSLYPWSVAN